MTDTITFLNWPGVTNWCNPDWAKAEINRRLKDQIMWLDYYYTDWTDAQKAKRAGWSLPYYNKLKRRFGLTKRRK